MLMNTPPLLVNYADAIAEDLQWKSDKEKVSYLTNVFNLRAINFWPGRPEIWRLINEEGSCAVFFSDTNSLLKIPMLSKEQSEHFWIRTFISFTLAESGQGILIGVVGCEYEKNWELKGITEAWIIQDQAYVSLDHSGEMSVKECMERAVRFVMSQNIMVGTSRWAMDAIGGQSHVLH